MARPLEPASVHHRTPIVEIETYMEVAGGVLFVFRDEHGVKVSLQFRSKVIDNLKQALEEGPIPAQE